MENNNEVVNIVEKNTGKKVKKLFDRIWVTVMIIINTAYGIFMTATAFAVVGDEYFCRDHWLGIIIGIITMVGINISNWFVRKLIKNY